jgi:hypothetical protein
LLTKKKAQEIDIWILLTLFYAAKANSAILFLIACLKASSRDITDYTTIIYSVWL